MSDVPTAPAADSSVQKQYYLAPGFTFSPTDEELIEYYLPLKIAGKSVPPGTILDFDIYSADPAKLPGFAVHGDRRNEKLFFTRRHASGRDSATGIRAKRTVAGQSGGSWYGHTAESRIQCKSGSVGVKVPFTFKRCEKGKSVGTEWIMHEYRLASEHCRFQEWAICRIYRKGTDQSKRDDEIRRVAAPPGGRLLPGYRFLPTDEEIIGHYLPLKLAGKAVLPSYIIDLDLYEVEPWRLSYKPMYRERRRELLFFTRRYNTGGSSVRARRTVADGGCWHANTETNVECKSGISGRKAFLTFKKMGTKGKCVTTDWIMQEFRLTGEEDHFQEWAICRVYFNKNKKRDESAVPIQESLPPMKRGRDEAQSPPHQSSSSSDTPPPDLLVLGDQTPDGTKVSGSQQASPPHQRPDSGSGGHSATPGAMERCQDEAVEAQFPDHRDKLDVDTLPDHVEYSGDRNHGPAMASGPRLQSPPSASTPASGSGDPATPARASVVKRTNVTVRPLELSPEKLLELMQSLFLYMPDWVDANMLQRWLRGGGATKRRKL